MSQNLVMYAPFSENFTQKYPTTSPSTLTGSPAITGGKLDLTGGAAYFVDFIRAFPSAAQQTGTIHFKLTPTYSGAPAATQYLFGISKQASDTSGAILLFHSASNGFMNLVVADSAGSTALNVVLGTWSAVASQEYDFELDYDFTNGATRLFIDGVQFGSIQTTVVTRGPIGLIRVGEHVTNQSVTSEFLLRDFVVFSDVLHTTDYEIVDPAFCRVYGVLRDMSGMPRNGATLKFTIYSAIDGLYAEAQGLLISTNDVRCVTGPDGYFQINLIRPNQYDNARVQYRVTILDGAKIINTLPDGTELKITVPNSASVDMATLLSP